MYQKPSRSKEKQKQKQKRKKDSLKINKEF